MQLLQLDHQPRPPRPQYDHAPFRSRGRRRRPGGRPA
jgi:hypothetical protein